VYMFFVLSGASMYVAYADRMNSGFPVSRFLAMRLVRLCPLYLLALALVFLLQMRGGLDLQLLRHAFLNIVFQFGLANPGTTSQVVGGWSLGIEFVFYLVFPVLLALVSGRWWWLVLLVAFTSQHVFIASVFSNGKGIDDNWSAYTQFLSFGFYFVAGCAIGRGLLSGWLKPHWLGAPVLVGLLATIGSASGSSWGQTIVGMPGLTLSLVAALAVAASAVMRAGPAGTWLSEQLGRASYGIYILHPFVMYAAKKLTTGAGVLVMTLAGSLTLALLLERYFERPVQRYFKRR
jgi:exopolysaccharide production protein ExoZ